MMTDDSDDDDEDFDDDFGNNHNDYAKEKKISNDIVGNGKQSSGKHC